MGVETVSNTLAGIEEPISHTGLPWPDLIQGEVLSPTELDMLCFVDNEGRSAPFCREIENKIGGKGGVGNEWEK